MTRALLVIAIGVCALCVPTHTTAQTPVLYPMAGSCCRSTNTRRCASAPIPSPPQPAPPPVDATLTRIDYDLRIENDAVAGRALLTIDVHARRLDARADPRGPDGARRATRWTAGLARRRAAAARAALARGPRRC